MVPEQDLLVRIEKFIGAVGMTAWAFGRETVNDTNLVDDLRTGRELRRGTRIKIEDYLERRHGEIAAVVERPSQKAAS